MNTPFLNRALRATTLLITCVSMIGCALSGRPDASPVATFVLEGTTTRPASLPAATNLVLKISTPDAAPAFASSRMAYIEQPYRIDYFAQNEWVDPPSRMLQTMLAQRLSATDLFRFVFTDSAGVDANLRLDSELIELVQVFNDSSSEVRLSIRFDLVDVAHRTILLSETISIAEETSTRDPYAGVVAANAAVQRALDQLVAKLRDPVMTLSSNP